MFSDLLFPRIIIFFEVTINRKGAFTEVKAQEAMEQFSLPRILGEGIYDSSELPKYRHGGVTPERVTDCFELELPLDKRGTIYIESSDRQSNPGFILVAKPGQRRHTLLPYRCQFIHLSCDGELSKQLASLPDFIMLSEPEIAQRLFGEFILHRAGAIDVTDNTQSTNADADNLLAYSRLFELFWMLVTESGKQSRAGQRSEAIETALRYVDAHLDSELTLDVLAGSCHMSPIYFHRLFKRQMGMTPYRYILAKKLTEAKKRLIMTNQSCLEIALGLGFSSQSYFNYSFRRETGLTPAQFRREHSGTYPDRG